MSSLARLAVEPIANVTRSLAWRSVALTWIAAIAIMLLGCEGTRKPLVADTPDPAWGALIAAHTSGPIPRKSVIRIAFARDVATSAQVGKPIKDALQVEPKLEGIASFENMRELVFRPRTDFVAGQRYRFELRSQALSELPKSLAGYRFIVQIQPAQFDLRFEGVSNRVDSDEMVLRGELATADVEDAAKIEELLQATYADQPARLQWQHGINPLLHRFTIASLKRGRQDQPLSIEWSGEPIG